MKKLISLLFIIFLFVNCSNSSDDDNSSSSSNSITPPSWIQGTWSQIISNNPYIAEPTLRFKNDDFCALVSSFEQCNAENIKQSTRIGIPTKVEQVISDKEYKLTITIQSQTAVYHFIKINPSKIEWVYYNNGLPNLQLIKK